VMILPGGVRQRGGDARGQDSGRRLWAVNQFPFFERWQVLRTRCCGSWRNDGMSISLSL
jgi:hypothetical protein